MRRLVRTPFAQLPGDNSPAAEMHSPESVLAGRAQKSDVSAAIQKISQLPEVDAAPCDIGGASAFGAGLAISRIAAPQRSKKQGV